MDNKKEKYALNDEELDLVTGGTQRSIKDGDKTNSTRNGGLSIDITTLKPAIADDDTDTHLKGLVG